MGLFLDLLHVPVAVTNSALEGIYKALSDGHDHGDDGIWKPHPSPLIRRLIELFTKRGLDRLASVHEQLLAWQAGSKHVATAYEIPTPPGMMARWNQAELALVKIYLESLPPAKWTLDDHMMAVDFVVQTYLPADALTGEADWLATRAALMGKVQANLDAAPTLKQADAILAGLPASTSMSRYHAAAMDFARVRCAEQVRALSEDVRHRMRMIVAGDLEQKSFGSIPAGTSSLETKLLDAFGNLNRDWRRIAVTEAGEAQLQGFIASLKPGAKVKRVERYDGACAFCRKIDGVVATVVASDSPNKDPDTMVWPGKNNIGRSASPRKRVGDVLIERDPEEMWWLPAGLVHPNCRGRWVLVPGDEPGDDPEFSAQLRAILGT